MTIRGDELGDAMSAGVSALSSTQKADATTCYRTLGTAIVSATTKSYSVGGAPTSVTLDVSNGVFQVITSPAGLTQCDISTADAQPGDVMVIHFASGRSAGAGTNIRTPTWVGSFYVIPSAAHASLITCIFSGTDWFQTAYCEMGN